MCYSVFASTFIFSISSEFPLHCPIGYTFLFLIPNSSVSYSISFYIILGKKDPLLFHNIGCLVCEVPSSRNKVTRSATLLDLPFSSYWIDRSKGKLPFVWRRANISKVLYSSPSYPGIRCFPYYLFTPFSPAAHPTF